MTSAEKTRRVLEAIRETEAQLTKSTKKYNDTITCLKMEIEINGNNKSANRSWVDYANQDKNRVTELKRHIEKLHTMLA